MNTKQSAKSITKSYPKILGKDRVLVVRKLRGIWKNRKPDPIKELQHMRQEWDRSASPSK